MLTDFSLPGFVCQPRTSSVRRSSDGFYGSLGAGEQRPVLVTGGGWNVVLSDDLLPPADDALTAIGPARHGRGRAPHAQLLTYVEATLELGGSAVPLDLSVDDGGQKAEAGAVGVQ